MLIFLLRIVILSFIMNRPGDSLSNQTLSYSTKSQHRIFGSAPDEQCPSFYSTQKILIPLFGILDVYLQYVFVALKPNCVSTSTLLLIVVELQGCPTVACWELLSNHCHQILLCSRTYWLCSGTKIFGHPWIVRMRDLVCKYLTSHAIVFSTWSINIATTYRKTKPIFMLYNHGDP